MRAKGNYACKVRVVYEASKTKHPYSCYVLTNRSSYYDSDEPNELDLYYIVSTTTGSNTTAVKTSTPYPNDPIATQLESLQAHFRENCGLHFENLTVDFIKEDTFLNPTTPWQMLGIISYKLDYNKTTKLSLHPFTLLHLDDQIKWEVSLPLAFGSNLQNKAMDLVKVDRRCSLCELYLPYDRVTKVVKNLNEVKACINRAK